MLHLLVTMDPAETACEMLWDRPRV